MMTDVQVHKVRFEPVGIEMEVEEGETVLNAALSTVSPSSTSISMPTGSKRTL